MLLYEKFNKIDLTDCFFDSLKEDYKEFTEWFMRKSEESAYVFVNSSGKLDGFLYLKIEEDSVLDVEPALAKPMKRLKVGTFKINAHGTKLGERFVKKIFDTAIYTQAEEVYVTAFEKYSPLLDIFLKYGFEKVGTKTTSNGTEAVYLKSFKKDSDNILTRYPLVSLKDRKIYLLSVRPEWHTQLLPDSILVNEDADIVQDISHTNSIHKVYLGGMKGMELLRAGDVILIYRTTDYLGPAHHRSVVTSVGVIEECLSINTFKTKDDFKSYCKPYSVFKDTQLDELWRTKKYPYLIRFTYNIALKKRVTRGTIIEEFGVDGSIYWGFMELSQETFLNIISRGKVNESLIVH